MGVEVLARNLSRLERLDGIQWWWVQVRLRRRFYSYFKESGGLNTICIRSLHYTHLRELADWQRQRDEIKCDTEEMMNLD